MQAIWPLPTRTSLSSDTPVAHRPHCSPDSSPCTSVSLACVLLPLSAFSLDHQVLMCVRHDHRSLASFRCLSAPRPHSPTQSPHKQPPPEPPDSYRPAPSYSHYNTTVWFSAPMATPPGDDPLMCPSTCAARAEGPAWNFLHPCNGSELGFFVASANAFRRSVVGPIPAHPAVLPAQLCCQYFASGNRAYKTRIDDIDHPQRAGATLSLLSLLFRHSPSFPSLNSAMVRVAVFAATVAAFTAAPIVIGQQIYDIWATTWERANLFTYTNLGSNPINFVTKGAIGDADIVVNDGSVLQSMAGFGATLTDSSAKLLSNMKSAHSSQYWTLINTLFEPNNHANAGLSYLRVPLGASDFSASVYSFDDTWQDTSLLNFNIDNAPAYLFSTITDIMSVNLYLKVHLLPWSPPAWMKSSGTMKGGSFISSYSTIYANYLLKALQGFKKKGITAYAIGIQNEPENSNPTYPTCLISASQEAQIGTTLRSLMNANGFSNVKIIGFDHNWNHAGTYPVQLMEQAYNSFSGVAFHCYSGSVGQQDTFEAAYPNKEIYFTECTGEYGSDWWSDIKWYMDNIFVGAVEHYAKSGLMWNIVLDGTGKPELPGSNSCGTPCRPVATVNTDGTYTLHQEFYAMAAASKAITPKDSGGPFAQRIGVSVGGSTNWALRVTAYVTARTNSADWLRYSLVVLNWDDTNNGAWAPTPVKTTIEFRGKQATYTFPVGVTTLWWYAPNEGVSRRDAPNANATEEFEAYAQTEDGPRKAFRFHRTEV